MYDYEFKISIQFSKQKQTKNSKIFIAIEDTQKNEENLNAIVHCAWKEKLNETKVVKLVLP